MKRLYLAVTFLCAIFLLATTTFAMPEYATRVGEPCGTCHASASGGGLRTPRGQAWVAQEKPNAVPTLEESLVILGVKLTANPAAYAAPSLPPPPPAKLATRYERKMWLLEYLMEYRGN